MKTETFGQLLDKPPIGEYGFVYKVKELSTNKLYVGSKHFYHQKIKNAESDWKTYRTSNTYLKTVIKTNINNYEFMILGFAIDETALKILEVEQMLLWNTLDPEIGYNANCIINLRSSIKNLTNRKRLNYE